MALRLTLFPLQQYHGGNLWVVPSREPPQIHAVSPLARIGVGGSESPW